MRQRAAVAQGVRDISFIYIKIIEELLKLLITLKICSAAFPLAARAL